MASKRDTLNLTRQWLRPIGVVMLDLIEKSKTLSPEEFRREVQIAYHQMPQLLAKLDIDALADVIAARTVNRFAEALSR